MLALVAIFAVCCHFTSASPLPEPEPEPHFSAYNRYGFNSGFGGFGNRFGNRFNRFNRFGFGNRFGGGGFRFGFGGRHFW